MYKVRNAISDRVEAMKVLLPDLATEPGLADRFLREIKAACRAWSTPISPLSTRPSGCDNQLLMLMEFVEGVTLEAALERRRPAAGAGGGGLHAARRFPRWNMPMRTA